jgi:hypothetical protein
MSEKSLYSQASAIAKKSWIKTNFKSNITSRFSKVIYFRLFKPLLTLRYNVYKKRHADTPWTSPASIAIFDQVLTKNMIGFEYGSGKSTKYFASKLRHLTSLEHDSSWFERVRFDIDKSRINNVDYHLIEKVESGEEIEEKVTIGNSAISHSFLPSFYTYSGFISQFPDEHFDFILVDGRARVDCIVRSIGKLKPGGILVLDNSERDRYRQAFYLLKDWPSVFTTTGITDTTLWFKP